jgi:hypothetical protein
MFESNNPARLTQLAIVAALLSFGVAWLLAPEQIELLVARDPQAQLPIVTLSMGALGAHALAAGLFAAFARFRSWTYPGFALSFLPVFIADYWLYAQAGAVNEMILVHAGGLSAVLALCARGFRQLQRIEDATTQLI